MKKGEIRIEPSDFCRFFCLAQLVTLLGFNAFICGANVKVNFLNRRNRMKEMQLTDIIAY
jgi:hypothetical protein